jgi:hypothetical protein
MTSIRISVDIPDPKKTITAAVKKNSIIDKVDINVSSFGSSTVVCNFDEKKYASIDKNKLERDLKAAINGVGYKTR